MAIAAVPTIWNGILFRSRTEARWAVFLDSLGVKYDYEAETYELQNGTRYLPDFWIAEWGLFIEVKGQDPTHEEAGKCRMLAEGSGKYTLCVVGAPSARFQRLYMPWSEYTDGMTAAWGRIEQCRRCTGHVLEAYSKPDPFETYFTHFVGAHENIDRCSDRGGVGVPTEAVARACTERFGAYA